MHSRMVTLLKASEYTSSSLPARTLNPTTYMPYMLHGVKLNLKKKTVYKLIDVILLTHKTPY